MLSFLGRTVVAVSFAALAFGAAAPNAEAGRAVEFDGTVMRIDYDRHAFLTQVEVRGRLLDVIVKAGRGTTVTEDGVDAEFGDIVIGDDVHVVGQVVRRARGGIVVAARLIDIDNSRAEIGDTTRIRGEVKRLSCERRMALLSAGRREVILVPARGAVITIGPDGAAIDFCRIPVGSCIAASGRVERRRDRVFFVADRIVVSRCPE